MLMAMHSYAVRRRKRRRCWGREGLDEFEWKQITAITRTAVKSVKRHSAIKGRAKLIKYLMPIRGTGSSQGVKCDKDVNRCHRLLWNLVQTNLFAPPVPLQIPVGCSSRGAWPRSSVSLRVAPGLYPCFWGGKRGVTVSPAAGAEGWRQRSRPGAWHRGVAGTVFSHRRGTLGWDRCCTALGRDGWFAWRFFFLFDSSCCCP